jgi:hypothetical protein
MVVGSQNRTVVSGLPRGHVRSYSDVTPSVADEQDSRQAQHTDKKIVKTILSHLLPTSIAMAPIQVSMFACVWFPYKLLGVIVIMLNVILMVYVSSARNKLCLFVS